MATFVLATGAWHGAWCYRDTARALRAKGHTVFTPTYTGLGEKAHANNQHITLETHVRDIIGCIESEELTDVVLLGHSYGGMVITSVADRMPEKIKSLVYLDAFVPEHGQGLIDLLRVALDPEPRDFFIGFFQGSALENNSGMMNPVPAEAFGIKAENCAWVNRRCVPQAYATFETPALLTGKVNGLKKSYILADAWDPSPFRYFAKKYDGQKNWTVVKMPSSHDVMVDMPNELAAQLEKLI